MPSHLHRPTHVYEPTTGCLYTLRVSTWFRPPVAGYYLRSERDRAGHEVAIFTRKPLPSNQHFTTTSTCRFRFDTGRRIRWMTNNRPEPVHFPKRKISDQCRLRLHIPTDIAAWIYATHRTPQTWVKILLKIFGSYSPELEHLLRQAPKTYDVRTMYAVAQHAGRYVTATQCKPHRRERTIGARNGYPRPTFMGLSTLEGLQFVRAHRFAHPWQSIPLSAARPDQIMLLPRPRRVLHTPADRLMRTLPTSLPARIRSPLEYAIHRWTNDSLDRWLSYLIMWAHSALPGHEVPIRVAARLAAVFTGQPWVRLFHQAKQVTGVKDPFSFPGVQDSAAWNAILAPGETDFIP